MEKSFLATRQFTTRVILKSWHANFAGKKQKHLAWMDECVWVAQFFTFIERIVPNLAQL